MTKAIIAAAISPGITLTQSNATTAVAEGGAFDSYTVVLNTKPGANITITLDNTNNQVDTDKVSLIFTPDNWSSPQTVNVSAVNDSVGEGLHKGVIKHTVGSADTSYNGIAVSTMQYNNCLPFYMLSRARGKAGEGKRNLLLISGFDFLLQSG